ncbi:MAG: dephospho-CoA kinase [Acidobacteriota bacterium]|jgi:dephospho-CoA kinase|nr:dephospho-CoA kinase [Acidobacteriota bacterium]
MLRVGLTGSIGVGKSFVSSVFAELGCHVLDADKTAREVVAAGTPGLRAVAEAFGSGILQPDGTLDRAALGAIIFADEEKRLLLNSILHPYIIAVQDEQLREWETFDAGGIAIIEAALMIESGGYKRFDKLIVIHCSPEIQLERLMARNHLSREEAALRTGAQMSQEEKKHHANFLIDTSNGFDDARGQTLKVYEKLREFVSSREQEVLE